MIAFVTILVSAATVVIGAPLQDEPEPNIIGGKPTTIEKYPHQVFLQVDNVSCGGAIINENHIVTALGCIYHTLRYSEQVKTIQVLVGVTDRTKEKGELFDVESFSSFNDPKRRMLSGDLAVLRLTKNITFGPKAQPIELVPENEETRPGEPLTIAGWGAMVEMGPLSSVLREVEVNAVSTEECRKAYNDWPWNLTEYMTCAALKNKGFCSGDLGGGLINSKKQLVGLASWAGGCAEPGRPGVYTNIANPDIRGFIVEHSQDK